MSISLQDNTQRSGIGYEVVPIQNYSYNSASKISQTFKNSVKLIQEVSKPLLKKFNTCIYLSDYKSLIQRQESTFQMMNFLVQYILTQQKCNSSLKGVNKFGFIAQISELEIRNKTLKAEMTPSLQDEEISFLFSQFQMVFLTFKFNSNWSVIQIDQCKGVCSLVNYSSSQNYRQGHPSDSARDIIELVCLECLNIDVSSYKVDIVEPAAHKGDGSMEVLRFFVNQVIGGNLHLGDNTNFGQNELRVLKSILRWIFESTYILDQCKTQLSIQNSAQDRNSQSPSIPQSK